MHTDINNKLAAKLRQISVVFGLLTFAGATLIFIGCMVDWYALQRLGLPGQGVMKANTALCLAIGGIIVYFPATRLPLFRWVVHGLGSLILMIAALTLTEYMLDTNLGIDEFFVTDRSGLGAYPGRMAVNTAFAFFFLGLYYTLMFSPKIPASFKQFLLVLMFCMTYTAILMHLLQIETLKGVARYFWVPVHTPFFLLLLTLGNIFQSLNSGFFRLIVSNFVGGKLARRLFLYLFTVPVLLAIPILYFYRNDRLEGDMAFIFFEIGYTLFFATMVWWYLQRIDNLDRQNKSSNEQLSKLNQELFTANEELKTTNEEILANSEEINAINEDLNDTNRKLVEANATIEKLSQEALSLSEEKFRELTESISDIFYAVDQDFRYIYWNKASEKLFNLPASQAIGKTIYELFPAFEGSAKESVFREVLSARTPLSIQQEIRIGEQKIFLEFYVYPSRIGLSVFAKDVTAQRHYENEIIQAKLVAESASRAKSNFLANMSHEVRTPLNGILGLAQIIENDYAQDSELQNYIQLIKESGLRLMNTMGAILDLSRIEAQHLEPQLMMCNLNKMISEHVAVFKPLADEKNIELSFEPPVQNYYALLDEKLFQQVISNLLNNAIKFTNQGSVKIFLHEDPKDRWINIHIADTGIGISEHFLNHKLFQPFEQESKGWSRNYQGTGLGLSIAKKYIDVLGGKIRVESKKNQGTVFTIGFKRQDILHS